MNLTELHTWSAQGVCTTVCCMYGKNTMTSTTKLLEEQIDAKQPSSVGWPRFQETRHRYWIAKAYGQVRAALADTDKGLEALSLRVFVERDRGTVTSALSTVVLADVPPREGMDENTEAVCVVSSHRPVFFLPLPLQDFFPFFNTVAHCFADQAGNTFGVEIFDLESEGGGLPAVLLPRKTRYAWTLDPDLQHARPGRCMKIGVQLMDGRVWITSNRVTMPDSELDLSVLRGTQWTSVNATVPRLSQATWCGDSLYWFGRKSFGYLYQDAQGKWHGGPRAAPAPALAGEKATRKPLQINLFNVHCAPEIDLEITQLQVRPAAKQSVT